jgi:hypothetical protein
MFCAAAVVLCLGPLGQTQTPQDEARAIIQKSIKAMGVDKAPDSPKGLRLKSTGTLELMGMTLNLSQTVTVRYTDQFKEAIELEVNNMKIPVVTVFDGKKGWVETGGQVIKLDDKVLAELKEVTNLMKVSRLKPLLGKEYELAVIGEVKVEGKPAIGIRVSTKGAKDVSLFFDKATNLLTKMDRQALDATTMQEVEEQRIIRSYKEKDGHKVPHQVAVMRDGKKFLEVEVTEFTYLDNVDASEFEAPK